MLKVEHDDLIEAKLAAMITTRNASNFIFYTVNSLLGITSNSSIVEAISKKLESLREFTDIVSNISQKLNQLDGSDLSEELDFILQGRQNDRIRITQLESDVQQLHAKEQRLVSVQASLSRISYILGTSENYNVDDNDDDDIDDDDAVIINGVQELHNSKASLEDRIQSAEYKIVKLREKMQSRKSKLKLSNESYKSIYDENREVREKLGGGLVSVLPALAENVMQELGNLSDELNNIRNAFDIQPEMTTFEYVNSVLQQIDDIRIALSLSADADILLCINNLTQRTTDLEHELSQAGKALELPQNKSLVIWAGDIKAERNAYKLENVQLIQRVETLKGDDTKAKSRANDLETQLNAAQQAAQFDPDKHDTLPDAINLFKKEISDTAIYAINTLFSRRLCSATDIYTTNECIRILRQDLERASSLNASLATVVGSGDADIMVHTKFIMSRISDLDAITNSIRAHLNLNDDDGTTPGQAVDMVLADLANANQVAEKVINVMIALEIAIPPDMTTSQGIDIISTRLRGCKDAADKVLSMVMRHMTDLNIAIPHSMTSLQGIEMISRSLTTCLVDTNTLRDALLSSLVEFGIPHSQDVSAKKAMSLISEKFQQVKTQLDEAVNLNRKIQAALPADSTGDAVADVASLVTSVEKLRRLMNTAMSHITSVNPKASDVSIDQAVQSLIQDFTAAKQEFQKKSAELEKLETIQSEALGLLDSTTINDGIRKLQGDLKQTDESNKANSTRLEAALSEKKDLNDKVNSLREDMNRTNEANSTQSEAAHAVNKKLNDTIDSLKGHLKTANEANSTALEAAQSQNKNLTQTIGSLKGNIKLSGESNKASSTRLEEAQSENKDLNDKIDSLKGELERTEESNRGKSTQLESANKKLNETIVKLQENLKRTNKSYDDKSTRLEAAQSQNKKPNQTIGSLKGDLDRTTQANSTELGEAQAANNSLNEKIEKLNTILKIENGQDIVERASATSLIITNLTKTLDISRDEEVEPAVIELKNILGRTSLLLKQLVVPTQDGIPTMSMINALNPGFETLSDGSAYSVPSIATLWTLAWGASCKQNFEKLALECRVLIALDIHEYYGLDLVDALIANVHTCKARSIDLLYQVVLKCWASRTDENSDRYVALFYARLIELLLRAAERLNIGQSRVVELMQIWIRINPDPDRSLLLSVYHDWFHSFINNGPAKDWNYAMIVAATLCNTKSTIDRVDHIRSLVIEELVGCLLVHGYQISAFHLKDLSYSMLDATTTFSARRLLSEFSTPAPFREEIFDRFVFENMPQLFRRGTLGPTS
jgi:DNA repair exonuclease SbcCD ATPase subunit